MASMNRSGNEVTSAYTNRADLGLQLDARASMNVNKGRRQSILEEIQQVVEDSKKES